MPLGNAYADKWCEIASAVDKITEVHHFVFVDSAAGSSKAIKLKLAEGLLTIFESLESFDRVTVTLANNEYSSGSTIFDRCLPACLDPTLFDKFGFGDCDTMRVRKAKHDFKNNLVARSVSLLSKEQTALAKSDLISTLGSASKMTAPGASIALFSDLQQKDKNLEPETIAGYDELFFSLVQNDRVPDLRSRKLVVFGHFPEHAKDLAGLKARREFWDDLFFLSGVTVVSIGQSY